MLKVSLKIYFRILSEFNFLKFRIIDLINFNYSKSICNIDREDVSNKRQSIINFDFVILNEYCASFKDNAQRVLNHQFNLLGSGWQSPKYNLNGINSYRANDQLIRVKKQMSLLLNLDINLVNKYIPIDWQLDFKSGFRWDEKTWYMDVSIGKHLGADIKVPWELSRLQHLPQLAISYRQDPSKEYLAKECVFQIRSLLQDTSDI